MILEEPDMGRPPKIVAPPVVTPGEPDEIAPASAKIVGHNIRRRRIAMELTQVQMAEQFGMHQQQLAKIELGSANLRLTTLERLSEISGMSISQLFSEIPDLIDGPQKKPRKPKIP